MKNKNFEKSLSWSITRNCNYNCSYCISPREEGDKEKYPEPYLFLDKFKKYLSGSWKIYISGGEPFLVPKFIDIAKELSEKRHRLVVMTNLSSSLDELSEFIEVTGNNLSHISASLHLGFSDIEEYLKKSVEISKMIERKFSVRIVAAPGKVLEMSEIGQKFKNRGINFFLRPEKFSFDKTQKQKEYSKKEVEILNKFKLHNIMRLTQSYSFKGKLCRAGSDYFSINEKGDAWRCHPAEKLKSKESYLGNFFDKSFELNKKAMKCPCQFCYCAHNIFYKNKLIL